MWHTERVAHLLEEVSGPDGWRLFRRFNDMFHKANECHLSQLWTMPDIVPLLNAVNFALQYYLCLYSARFYARPIPRLRCIMKCEVLYGDFYPAPNPFQLSRFWSSILHPVATWHSNLCKSLCAL